MTLQELFLNETKFIFNEIELINILCGYYADILDNCIVKITHGSPFIINKYAMDNHHKTTNICKFEIVSIEANCVTLRAATNLKFGQVYIELYISHIDYILQIELNLKTLLLRILPINDPTIDYIKNYEFKIKK